MKVSVWGQRAEAEDPLRHVIVTTLRQPPPPPHTHSYQQQSRS